MNTVTTILGTIVISVLLCVLVFAYIVRLEGERTEERCRNTVMQICSPCKELLKDHNENHSP